VKSLLQTPVRVIGTLLLAGALGGCWVIWNFNRPPFDLTRLQQLRPGMSRAEVRHVLGSPKSDYGDHWAYSRFMAWPVVYVRFDEGGRFTRSDYDY
jgi:hypothetical protein